MLRLPEDVNPSPATETEILRLAVSELAGLPSGGHLDPNDNDAYSARRRVSAYAYEMGQRARAARTSSPASV